MGSIISRCICCSSCQRICNGKPKKSRKESAETLAADSVVNNFQQPLTETKKYSWDLRTKVNPEEYTISDLNGAEKVKLPGEINGQQFIIKNCNNSKIYLFDVTSTVTIDDCSDCLFVFGPVTQSIFLRDTTNSTLVSASSQLRLRDCKDIHLFIACESDPIIEASSGIVCGPYFLHYKGIEDHFKAAQISNFKAHHWFDIYDFTPNDLTPNWSRYSRTKQVERYVCPPSSTDQYSDLQMTMAEFNSYVPVTNYIGDDAQHWKKVAVTFTYISGTSELMLSAAQQFYKEIIQRLMDHTAANLSQMLLTDVDLEQLNDEQKQVVFTFSCLETDFCLKVCQAVKTIVVTSEVAAPNHCQQANNIRITRKN